MNMFEEIKKEGFNIKASDIHRFEEYGVQEMECDGTTAICTMAYAKLFSNMGGYIACLPVLFVRWENGGEAWENCVLPDGAGCPDIPFRGIRLPRTTAELEKLLKHSRSDGYAAIIAFANSKACESANIDVSDWYSGSDGKDVYVPLAGYM